MSDQVPFRGVDCKHSVYLPFARSLQALSTLLGCIVTALQHKQDLLNTRSGS